MWVDDLLSCQNLVALPSQTPASNSLAIDCTRPDKCTTHYSYGHLQLSVVESKYTTTQWTVLIAIHSAYNLGCVLTINRTFSDQMSSH